MLVDIKDDIVADAASVGVKSLGLNKPFTEISDQLNNIAKKFWIKVNHGEAIYAKKNSYEDRLENFRNA